MKIVLIFSLAVFPLLFAVGCRREEQKPMVQAQQMPSGHEVPAAKSEAKLVVPESVKARWAAVRLTIEDKSTMKKQDVTVRLYTGLQIPDSNLKVFVGDFLPAFTMSEGLITSASNEPDNPAVGIRVLEGDKQIFPAAGKEWGWLFSKFPEVHPFEHQRYELKLKEGVEKTM